MLQELRLIDFDDSFAPSQLVVENPLSNRHLFSSKKGTIGALIPLYQFSPDNTWMSTKSEKPVEREKLVNRHVIRKTNT